MPDPMPETALILAGGLGTRLRPILPDHPKVLAPVAGQPFLGYLLDYLASQGIQRVILAVGYLADQVLAFVRDGKRGGIEIEAVQEETPLGTAGAVRLASQGLADEFFALNGDTLFQVELAELWQRHRQFGPANTPRILATVSLRVVVEGNFSDDARQRGIVNLDRQGMITAFSEKPQRFPQSMYSNGGIYLLSPSALVELPLGEPSSLEQDVFPRLAARGQLAGCPQRGYFVDIGTPFSLAGFEQDVLSGKFSVRNPTGNQDNHARTR